MRLRRISSARLRSFTGVIIGLYVTMHLTNHALGLISVDAQERARPYFMAFWHSPPGQVLLYGSLIAHAISALGALARRRQYRMPIWEGTQILLGLAIPYLLLVHIVNTRGTRILTGIDINYPYEIANLWVTPWNRFCQIALVLLVWGHFVVGLHFWLRIRGWYRRAFPSVLLFYVLVPVCALLGFAQVGMEATRHAERDPAWIEQMKTAGVPGDPHRASLRATLKQWAGPSWLGLVALVFLGSQVRNWRLRDRRFRVRYPDDFSVGAAHGMSILEVSRMAHRPHLSVCGGRARCTTCRIRVERSDEDLPKPNELEADALARIGAPTGLRLACQLRPHSDLSVTPLLHPSITARSGNGRAALGKDFGEERRVTVLFIDLRGSTSLAEARLPYDAVFLLNYYFAEMAAAVEDAGGHYSNFTGDGLMALFGLSASPNNGARAALDCALQMLDRMAQLNQRLAAELSEPLAIGVGIHTGEAIVGRMGPPKTPVLTALGDVVNTAARLESASKELHAPVVVSCDLLESARLTTDAAVHDLLCRGRSATLRVCALDLPALRDLLAVPQEAGK